MKYIFYILLFTTSAFSQNYHYALHKEDPISPEIPIDRNTDNLMYVETFENPNLDSNPNLSDFYLESAKNHSFSQDRVIKKHEQVAGRFEIKKDDPKIWGSTRAEMSQAQGTAKSEGWYGFSQYFPDSYVSDDTEEVVGQWHDQSDDGEHVARSPSNALITGSDRIKWMIRWDEDRIMDSGYSDGTIYIDLGKIPKNKWIDWVVHIKFAHDNTGVLEVWKDGEKVINRQNMPNSYNDESYPYLKFGVYKWKWGTVSSPRVIYYDEVRIGNENSNFNDVNPSGN